LYLLYKNSVPDPWLYGFSLGFFLINLLNLLPIFPLDGGRILKIIFLNNSIILSNIFSALSIIAVIYFSLSQKDYLFLFFGFILLIGLINTIQKQKLIKILKADGINLDTTYEEINKEQYTHIRQRMLQTISAYKKYDLFDFDIHSGKEKLLAKEMGQIFKPAPINDMKLHHKILITGVWAGCFAIPFMIDLPIPFINS
jgi:stage IV sporulation protein FB